MRCRFFCVLLFASMSIVERLKAYVEEALQDCDGGVVCAPVLIETCRHSQYGDYSCAVAVKLAQGQESVAFGLGQKIATRLTSICDRQLLTINVSPPGFINFALTNNFLSSVLLEINARFSEQTLAPEIDDVLVKNCFEQCCDILRCARQPVFDLLNDAQLAPLLTESQWQKCKLEYKNDANSFDAGFDKNPLLLGRQKSLILMLERALRTRSAPVSPEIAQSFATFYQSSRVFANSLSVTKARLGLVLAVKLVLEYEFCSKS